MKRPPFDPSKTAASRRTGLFARQNPPGEPPAAVPDAGGGGGLPPGSPAESPPPERALSVSDLAERIDAALRTGTPSKVRVLGEVSGFKDRTHWYFDLKDAEAVVSCVMFAGAARKASATAAPPGGRWTPENGQAVVVTGRVEFYAKSGRVSFIVERIEPVGAGALDLAFRRLCDELRALGWFDVGRKRPLPSFPRRVAVVTSRTGAALQDVLVTMRRRCPAVGVLVVDARVQGEGAAPEVARAIDEVSARAAELGVDAVLVTRGGGSKEDLWAFNEREVARAIVACSVPVAAAIGHETDTTIAELVADERCATPTQAAMRLTPDASALASQVDSASRRLWDLLRRRLALESQRLASLARHPAIADPGHAVDAASARLRAGEAALHAAMRERLGDDALRAVRAGAAIERLRPGALLARSIARLDSLARRLDAAPASKVASARERLARSADRLARVMPAALARDRSRTDAVERHLGAVSPLRVLERGFSITTDADGRVVRDPSAVKRGDVIDTRVAMGEIRSRVEGTAPGDATTPAAARPDTPTRRKPSPRHPAGNPSEPPSLFGPG
ncbi:MAG: exodeoxyribonuclease VII large subunit [Phycisphaeraceae bacterium]|nr:MAG: exodeoxyribonuclease VII large subunit [Phycisphaeraceae bacterium]